MGLLDKFMGKVNPDNNDDYEDSYVFDGADDDNGQNQYGGGYDNSYAQGQMQGGAPMNNNMGMQNGYGQQGQPYGGGMQMQGQQQMTIDSNSLELKVVRPERSDMVFQIADHLLNGRTVVLNLEATNGENQRRMIDFLTGVAYSIGGDLRKVANKTYVITPNNVDVSADGAAAAAASGQSQGGMQGSAKDLFSDI